MESAKRLVLLLGLFSLAAPQADASVDLVQDRDAVVKVLRMLQTAQESLKTQFPQGLLRASVRDTLRRKEAEVLNIWKGDNLYVEADWQEWVDASGEGKFTLSQGRSIQIYRRTSSDFYTVNGKLVQRVDNNETLQGWPLLRLRPDDCWYRKSAADRMDWAARLERFVEGRESWKTTTETHSDGRVIVTNLSVPTGCFIRSTFSLEAGGNLIEFEQSGPDSDKCIFSRGKYTWRPIDSRWYLESMSVEVPERNGGGIRGGVYVSVSEFDPNPTIDDDQFSFDALPLESGTIVEHLGANPRRYRVGWDGKPEAAVTESVLRGLANEVFSRGFARKP